MIDTLVIVLSIFVLLFLVLIYIQLPDRAPHFKWSELSFYNRDDANNSRHNDLDDKQLKALNQILENEKQNNTPYRTTSAATTGAATTGAATTSAATTSAATTGAATTGAATTGAATTGAATTGAATTGAATTGFPPGADFAPGFPSSPAATSNKNELIEYVDYFIRNDIYSPLIVLKMNEIEKKSYYINSSPLYQLTTQTISDAIVTLQNSNMEGSIYNFSNLSQRTSYNDLYEQNEFFAKLVWAICIYVRTGQYSIKSNVTATETTRANFTDIPSFVETQISRDFDKLTKDAILYFVDSLVNKYGYI